MGRARENPLVVFLMGPTASGKTGLALELARELPCELVSVDATQIYRGLDIGSAKSDFPHRLVDIRDPLQPYSVAEFCEDARGAIEDISAAGGTPLLVGGTMMYFKALLEGLSDMPPANPELRRQLARQADEKGWPHLHSQLQAVDPVAAARIHPNHSRRIGRALEVYLSSGVTLTDWHERDKGGNRQRLGDACRLVQLAIAPVDRAVLHRRIEERVDQMLEAGLVEEVKALCERGDLHPDLPALRAVGYRQMWDCVQGKCSIERARELTIAATRQLARHQLVWLRKWPDLQWIYTDESGAAAPTLELLAAPPEQPAASPQTPLQVALKHIGGVV